MMYVTNAFSLNMLDAAQEVQIQVRKTTAAQAALIIQEQELDVERDGVTFAVGHQDTATLLEQSLNFAQGALFNRAQ